MKTEQFDALYLSKNPLVEASAEIVMSLATAIHDNFSESVDLATRFAKSAPNPDFVKLATDELTSFQARALSRLSEVSKQATEAVLQQSHQLAKQAEAFQAKFNV